MKMVKALENGSLPAAAKGAVRVKILKYVGQFTPGDIVDCDEETAKHLLKETKVNSGEQMVSHVKAMKLEDVIKLKEQKLTAREIKLMTAKEMADLGLRNIVKTPRDDQFEANLAIAKKAAEKAQKGKKAMMDAKAASEAEAEKPVEV